MRLLPTARAPRLPQWSLQSDASFEFSALVLRLARGPKIRIGAVLQQQFHALLVIKDPAQPIALPVRRAEGGHTRLADSIHVYAQIDHLREQRVPSAIRRTEQRVLVDRCLA